MLMNQKSIHKIQHNSSKKTKKTNLLETTMEKNSDNHEDKNPPSLCLETSQFASSRMQFLIPEAPLHN